MNVMNANATATARPSNLLENLNNDNLVKWMNSPNVEVTMRLIRIDSNYKSRTVIIELSLFTKTTERDYYNTYLVQAKLTKHLYNWFHDNRSKDSKGEYTIPCLTPYQKYLQSRDLPVNTKIQDIGFNCINSSEEYKDMPFRLKINKSYGTATLYNVQEPNYYKVTKFDPNNPDTPIERLYQPKNPKTGYVMGRSKANYRRLEVS